MKLNLPGLFAVVLFCFVFSYDRSVIVFLGLVLLKKRGVWRHNPVGFLGPKFWDDTSRTPLYWCNSQQVSVSFNSWGIAVFSCSREYKNPRVLKKLSVVVRFGE